MSQDDILLAVSVAQNGEFLINVYSEQELLAVYDFASGSNTFWPVAFEASRDDQNSVQTRVRLKHAPCGQVLARIGKLAPRSAEPKPVFESSPPAADVLNAPAILLTTIKHDRLCYEAPGSVVQVYDHGLPVQHFGQIGSRYFELHHKPKGVITVDYKLPITAPEGKPMVLGKVKDAPDVKLNTDQGGIRIVGERYDPHIDLREAMKLPPLFFGQVKDAPEAPLNTGKLVFEVNIAPPTYMKCPALNSLLSRRAYEPGNAALATYRKPRIGDIVLLDLVHGPLYGAPACVTDVLTEEPGGVMVNAAPLSDIYSPMGVVRRMVSGLRHTSAVAEGTEECWRWPGDAA